MHHRLLPRTLLLASFVSACGGQVVEGTGAGTSGDGSSGGSSGGSTTATPTTATPTSAEPTSAEPTTGAPTTGSEPTSAGPDTTDSSGAVDPDTGGTSETGGSDDTGESSSGGAGVCGDGAVGPGEVCDDANADQTDGCTTLCRAPKNCLELLMLAPEAKNEAYLLDPESDGSTLKLYCDMMGGGWTQVYYDAFDSKNGWSAGEISECGELGTILGGAGQFGYDDSTQKQIGLQNVAHTELRLIAELAIIDSWDDEEIFAEVDGEEVAKKKCVHYDANSCGQNKQQCGGANWKDGNQTIAGDREHAGDSAVVKFFAELSEGPDNEAWGLDTVYVFVK